MAEPTFVNEMRGYFQKARQLGLKEALLVIDGAEIAYLKKMSRARDLEEYRILSARREALQELRGTIDNLVGGANAY